MKKNFYFFVSLVVICGSAAFAEKLSGVWSEDVQGYSRCYPVGFTPGTQPIHFTYCGVLRGTWGQDIHGYTRCYRTGSGVGAQPIDNLYCQ